MEAESDTDLTGRSVTMSLTIPRGRAWPGHPRLPSVYEHVGGRNKSGHGEQELPAFVKTK